MLASAEMHQKSARLLPSFSFGFGGMAKGKNDYYGDSYSAPMYEVEEQKVSLHSSQFIQRFDTSRPATIPSDGTEHKVTTQLNKQTQTI